MKPSKFAKLALLISTLLFIISCSDDDDHDHGTHVDTTIKVDVHGDEVVDQTKKAANTITASTNFLFHDEESEITGTLAITGATADDVHIHPGYAGQTGIPIITLTDVDGDGTWTIPEDGESLTAEQKALMEAGGYYINAHFDGNTTTLRGQLIFGDIEVVYAPLSKSADAASTTGSGFAAITTNKSTKEIITYVTINGITVTNVHIHFNKETTDAAKFGSKLLTVDAADSTIYTSDNGTTDDSDSLTADQFEEAQHGRWYVNVHTDANPTGELRAEFGEFGTHE